MPRMDLASDNQGVAPWCRGDSKNRLAMTLSGGRGRSVRCSVSATGSRQFVAIARQALVPSVVAAGRVTVACRIPGPHTTESQLVVDFWAIYLYPPTIVRGYRYIPRKITDSIFVPTLTPSLPLLECLYLCNCRVPAVLPKKPLRPIVSSAPARITILLTRLKPLPG